MIDFSPKAAVLDYCSLPFNFMRGSARYRKAAAYESTQVLLPQKKTIPISNRRCPALR